MKPLILSFFAVILIYSLFFDQDEKRERDYQFLDSSMNLDKEALGQYPTDSISFLASSNKERAMSVE